ncbi:hypothetical protein DCK06_00190 [Listeria monocytogenes]|nr:hypothetical protein DCK06_00190 [Listeria monocytogenes]
MVWRWVQLLVSWRCKMKIEFRGKSKADGAWHYGYYHCNRETPIIVYEWETPTTIVQNRIPVYPKTVGQYTNVDTPDGKKIFEDDYVLVKDCHPTGYDDFYGVVEFLEGAWWVDNELMQKAVLLWNESNEIEILGNIHENPDLLEVAE